MRKPRRRRGAAESLASIVLAFESVIAFLGGLVIYGLKVLQALRIVWDVRDVPRSVRDARAGAADA